MDTIRIELLTEDILARFKGTQSGHCARVDFLTTAEAEHICQYLSTKQTKDNITAHILAKQGEVPSPPKSSIHITIDKAIELRNRKQEKLCLFVPADLVDAAYSSLANSFAIIDGRTLHTRALRRLMTQLPTKSSQFVRATFSQLRGVLNVSEDQKLDFAIAVLKRAEEMELDQAGLELWRVGLIADATVGELADDLVPSGLEYKLRQNRSCALALAHPLKIDATTRERIQILKVDEATTAKLMTFFRKRSLNDVQSGSLSIPLVLLKSSVASFS
jgi:DNA phosphorothioation-dependent restriction protein DptH